MADPLQLSDLRTQVQFLTGDIRTDTATTTDRDNCINNALIDLAGMKGYWRQRSTTVSLTAGTVAYNAPSDFDSIQRLYYRYNGVAYDIPFLSDSEWLERSATRSVDAGHPRWARWTQTSLTQNQFELTPPPSSTFVTNVSSTLTCEYFIELVRLTAATDEVILPANLRHAVVYAAAHEYALGQSDFNLADRLERKMNEWKTRILRKDLTRTGRPRQLRPRGGYQAISSGASRDFDYGGD